jgi:hypothetical protein
MTSILVPHCCFGQSHAVTSNTDAGIAVVATLVNVIVVPSWYLPANTTNSL